MTRIRPAHAGRIAMRGLGTFRAPGRARARKVHGGQLRRLAAVGTYRAKIQS
jgi:hypothetical protein